MSVSQAHATRVVGNERGGGRAIMKCADTLENCTMGKKEKPSNLTWRIITIASKPTRVEEFLKRSSQDYRYTAHVREKRNLDALRNLIQSKLLIAFKASKIFTLIECELKNVYRRRRSGIIVLEPFRSHDKEGNIASSNDDLRFKLIWLIASIHNTTLN